MLENKEQELVILLQEMPSIIYEIIEGYAQFYKKVCAPTRDILFKSRTCAILFKREYSSQNITKKEIILPASIGHQFQEYAESNTPFGEYIQQYLDYYPSSEHSKLFELRKQRCEALSMLLQHTHTIKYRAGAFYPFDLRYMDHEGFPNKIRDIFWNIKQIFNFSLQL